MNTARYLAGCLLAVWAGLATAHPHVWIDLQVMPQVNAQGQLTGFYQRWRFDPFYSLVIIEEIDRGGPAAEKDQRFDAMASLITANLQQYRFFTRIQQQGVYQVFRPVEEAYLRQQGNRVEYGFELHLQTPLSLQQTVEYQVYDPSYYIDIQHHQEQGINRQQLPAACQIDRIAPTPDIELIQQALALDDNEVPAEDSQLGQFFAERVRLLCPENP